MGMEGMGPHGAAHLIQSVEWGASMILVYGVSFHFKNQPKLT